MPAYAASKAGLNALSQSLAKALAPPQEVAQVVAYRALDAPASMTGGIVEVNGASYLRTWTLLDSVKCRPARVAKAPAKVHRQCKRGVCDKTQRSNGHGFS